MTRLNPQQLEETAVALEAQAGSALPLANSNTAGQWARIAYALETIAGATTQANPGITGSMLRAAVAAEAIEGGDGTEENASYHGLLERLVDALELQTGDGTGTIAGRLRDAVLAWTSWGVDKLFAADEQGAWYDPSDLSTMFTDEAGTNPAAVGSLVARINDKSGNGNNATTATNQPTLRQDASGNYYLEFVGNQRIRALFAISQPWERITALRQNTWTTTDRIYGGGNANTGLLYQTGASPAIHLFSGAAGPSSTAATLGTNRIITERHNGASSRIAVDNGAYTTGNAGATLPGGITIGAGHDSANASDIRFYGSIMRAGQMDDETITKTREFLAAKSAVTL